VNTYFLTIAQRAEIISEAVQVDCEANCALDPDTYRAELESLNNSELVKLCCNW
jgi:hypothetical protein